MVEHLARKQGEVAVALDRSTAALREAIETSAGQSVGAVTGAHEKIRNELTEVLGRLGETNTALQTIVGQASTGLSALDTTLGEKLREMRGAIEQASADLTRATGAASSVVGDARGIVGEVDAHSASLAQSAAELARTQSELDETLNARRRSLTDLLTQLEARRDDFDNVLTSFAGLVENSFRQSEARAREIGAFLTEASQSTVASVEQQFGEIRAATGRERERTAAALRAAYEQANEQMTRLFGEATERFSTAATDIRSMTAEIQRELETTREHVSRGVADLPRETAEQANTMRRIVGDQIKALNELTSIVTRAGGGRDVAEAAPAMPAARHIAPASQPAPELRRTIEPQRPQESVAPAPVAPPPPA